MPDQIQQYRFYSKILLAFTLVMIGIILTFSIFHSYQGKLQNAERAELNNLSSIVKTIALQIDGDVHQQLACDHPTKDAIKTNEENEDYHKIYQLLDQTQKINGLESPIYTIFQQNICKYADPSDEHYHFGVSSETPYFRHHYLDPPSVLVQSFEKGGTIEEYEDDYGKWISAFHPIKNSEGKTIGVVQADRIFDTFIAEARMTLWNESLYALLFLFVITGIFVFVYRYILNSMSKINLTLEEAVRERTKKLNQSNLELKRFNDKLESTIQERTQQVKTTNQQLTDSNEKLKAFARVASHDLRAPLRSIKGFAQLFKRRYGKLVDEDGMEFLDFITTNSQKMSDLISEILATSLTPTDENMATEKSVDLNEVVRDVKVNLKADIEKYSAKILFDDLPSIFGFRSDFIQLFQNFISNSIKYHCPERLPEIRVEAQKKDDHFSIKISDNGKGITPEALETIFKEFDRGDATDKEGYGIGLATCQRIIKGYDGKLNVTSEVGVGSCFEFILKNRSIKIETPADAVEVALGEALRN